MSKDYEDSENINFDSNWECCCQQTNKIVNISSLSICDDNDHWLSIKLPHIVNNDNIISSYNWWYRKKFNWIVSDEKVYLMFDSNTSNITATISINGTIIFSNSLLSEQNKIELTDNLIKSNQTTIEKNHPNILVVCCSNTTLSLHVRLIIHGTIICASGKVKIDNNHLNDQKEKNILQYTVRVNDTDGRIRVIFKNRQEKFRSSLPSAIDRRDQPVIDEKQTEETKEDFEDISVPHLAVLILIVGTRGDVQPFIALGQSLLAAGHRVRLATHEAFRSFVRGNGLEFFPLAGDPADLMSFMVKNAGIIPSVSSIIAGDVAKNRRILADILASTWLACTAKDDETLLPFTAEAIIANPPSFGHIHCAEKLQIPLHIMFTMPWSPTTAFPHPLCNIDSSKGSKEKLNLYSYHVVNILTWSAMHKIVNNFRKKILGLSSLSTYQATNLLIDERVPHTYCWSTALASKPSDWEQHINVSGFFFLDLGTAYTDPPQDLLHFLGINNDHHHSEMFPPPIYIGFGSITGHDSRHLLQVVLDALDQTGYRALLSGLATDTDHLTDQIFKIGNVPHDWLFQHVSAVCHHGGAGTTAAGLRAGKPTIIVPFFGDQFFWGNIIENSGAGPRPLPGKSITAAELAEAFRFVHQPTARAAAERIRLAMEKENGCKSAVRAFHAHLPIVRMRSDLESTFAACYRIDGLNIQISLPVVHVLVSAGLIDITQVRSHPIKKWQFNHDHHIRTITHTASEHIKKSFSNLIFDTDMSLRQTVSSSTNNLPMNEDDQTESIASHLQQYIDYQKIDPLSSYGKKIDATDRVPPLYDPYSEPNTHVQPHLTGSKSAITTTGRSLWHSRKIGLISFLKRLHPDHQPHHMTSGTAEALIATGNTAIEPAVGAFPSTTWLGQPTFDTIKETVLKYKTVQIHSQPKTLELPASSLTTSDEQHENDDHEKSASAKIAAVISGFPVEICQQILLEYDQIKMERKQTTISSLSPKKHWKHKFEFRRQRSHSTSSVI